MQTYSVEYRFRLPGEREVSFPLNIDAECIESVDGGGCGEDLPEWTRLDFHQCSNCPINGETQIRCPLMVNLVRLVEPFDTIVSYDEVQLEVTTHERCITQRTTAQRGISSLMGLLIATSGCPHTIFFKPMARFHLPLASEEETLFRAASTYLLAQYFRHQEGKPADFKLGGLRRIYLNMQEVNVAVAERLRSASRTDSSANAIIRLDMFAKTVPMVIEEAMDEIRYLFLPYLDETRKENHASKQ